MVLDWMTYGYRWRYGNTEQSLGVKSLFKDKKKIHVKVSLQHLQGVIVSLNLCKPVLL